MSAVRKSFWSWFNSRSNSLDGVGCWGFVFGGALLMAFAMLPCILLAWAGTSFLKDSLRNGDQVVSVEASATMFAGFFLGGVLLLLGFGLMLGMDALRNALQANALATMRLAEKTGAPTDENA